MQFHMNLQFDMNRPRLPAATDIVGRPTAPKVNQHVNIHRKIDGWARAVKAASAKVQ